MARTGEMELQPVETGARGPQIRGERSTLTSSAIWRCVAFGSLVVVFEIFRPLMVGIDYERPEEIDPQVLRLVLLFVYGVFLALALGAPGRFITIAVGMAPVFLVLLLAFLSASWSPVPALSLQKALTSFALAIGACALVARLGAAQVLRLIAWVLALGVVASVLAALLVPDLGVHQRQDAFEFYHAGMWRGVFYHRVLLGQFAAFTLAVWLFAAGGIARWPVRLAIILASVACLAGARSAGSFVTVGILVTTAVIMRFAGMWRRQERSKVLVLLAIAAVPVGLLVFWVLPIVVASLGRDLTFTGRWSLWVLLVDVIAERPWLGHGFNAGYWILRPAFEMQFGYDFVHPHSGYFDMAVGLGLVGLALCLVFLLWFVLAASRLVFSPAGTALGALRYLPFLTAVFTIEVNLVEAMLVESRGFGAALAFTAFACLRAPELRAGPASEPDSAILRRLRKPPAGRDG